MDSDDIDKEHSKDVDIITDINESCKRVQIKIKNPRYNLTAKKYQKQVDWRRNKVKELLYRGYSQQEIISVLHVSQPTISRDIAVIYGQSKKRSDNIGKLLFEEQSNTLNGYSELLKEAWNILKNPKTEDKVKLKTMDFIENLYIERFRLLQGYPIIFYFEEKAAAIKRKEQYFKDMGIELDYRKPISRDGIRLDVEEINNLDNIDRLKEAVF
jgi:predicted transcriptional regulator